MYLQQQSALTVAKQLNDLATLGRMVGCHGTVASNAAHQSLEQRSELVANGHDTGFAVMSELLVDVVPKFLWDDCLMFPLVDLFLVPNLAKVGDVGEQFEQRALVEKPAAAFFAFLGNAKFVPPIASFDFVQRGHNRSAFEIELVDQNHVAV